MHQYKYFPELVSKYRIYNHKCLRPRTILTRIQLTSAFPPKKHYTYFNWYQPNISKPKRIKRESTYSLHFTYRKAKLYNLLVSLG